MIYQACQFQIHKGRISIRPFLMFHVKHFWYKSLNFHFYTFCVIIKVRIKKGG
nr:MAG TPA: hypothetical protein [Caudoviricetes sp.]